MQPPDQLGDLPVPPEEDGRVVLRESFKSWVRRLGVVPHPARRCRPVEEVQRDLAPDQQCQRDADQRHRPVLQQPQRQRHMVRLVGRVVRRDTQQGPDQHELDIEHELPRQWSRLSEIIHNLRERVREARGNGWLGEVEGLQGSLDAAPAKLNSLSRAPADGRPQTVELGMPIFTDRAPLPTQEAELPEHRI